jgi:site-specific DNA-cytosine methylase
MEMFGTPEPLSSSNNVAPPLLTAVSFFAGYGGIDLGLHRIFGQRLRTIAYCEREAYAVANLLSKMDDDNSEELRLLGNGCYPDTVALAFATLYGRIKK